MQSYVHNKSFCVTEKKMGKYFVKKGEENRQRYPQKQRLLD